MCAAVTAASAAVSPLISDEARRLIPDVFLREIDDQNNKHFSEIACPTALVLISKEDDTKAIYNPYNYLYLQNISKTHRVAIEIIKEVGDIKLNIDKQDKPVDLLVIEAHGNEKYIEIGEKSNFKAEDVKPEIFDKMALNGDIFLLSCDAGKGLAQKIADITKLRVFAPIHGIKDSDIKYGYTDGKPKIAADDQNGAYVFIYENGKAPQESIVNQKDTMTSDPKLLLEAGSLYENQKKNINAKYFYYEAAKKGYFLAEVALYMLNLNQCKDKGDKEGIKKWTLEIAKLQYKRGIELIGNGDNENGLNVITRAAKKGLVEAKQYLANYYFQNKEFVESEKWLLEIEKEDDLIIKKDVALKLAEIYQKRGEYSQAKLKIGMFAIQADSEAQYLYGKILIDEKIYIDRGIEIIQQVANSGLIQAQQYLYKYFWDQGDYNECEKWLLKLNKKENDIPIRLEATAKLGWLYYNISYVFQKEYIELEKLTKLTFDAFNAEGNYDDNYKALMQLSDYYKTTDPAMEKHILELAQNLTPKDFKPTIK